MNATAIASPGGATLSTVTVPASQASGCFHVLDMYGNANANATQGFVCAGRDGHVVLGLRKTPVYLVPAAVAARVQAPER